MVDALGQNMTCQEVTPLISLFFDGELEGPHMRAVALHMAQCEACTGALSCLAQLQHLVAEAVTAQLEEIDPSCVWQGVAEQIEHLSLPWSSRLRMWWEGVVSWRSGIPVIGASAAAALLFLAFLWWGDEGSNEPPQVVARNQAHVESLSTSMPAIAMWSEQKEGTTVIWVAGEESRGEGQRVP